MTGDVNVNVESTDVHARLDTIERVQRDQGLVLADNTTVTMEIKGLLDGFKNGMKFLGWCGVALKWLGGAAGGALALWGLISAMLHGLPGAEHILGPIQPK